jgi:hypothetical protein
MFSAFQNVDQFREEDEPDWLRALYKTPNVAEKSRAYFDKLFYDTRKPSRN